MVAAAEANDDDSRRAHAFYFSSVFMSSLGESTRDDCAASCHGGPPNARVASPTSQRPGCPKAPRPPATTTPR